MEYNPSNKQKGAIIGIGVVVIILLLEVYFGNYFNRIPEIYPLTLSVGLFCIGYALAGTVKGGLLSSVWFLSFVIILVLATLISTNPILLFPLILIVIGVLAFYIPVLKAIKKQDNNQLNNKVNSKVLVLLFLLIIFGPLLEIIINKIVEVVFR